MTRCVFLVLGLVVFSTDSFGQLPFHTCDREAAAIHDCTSAAAEQHGDAPPDVSSLEATGQGDAASAWTTTTPASSESRGIHWRRALRESFTFLLIEQAYVIHTDFNWVVSENGIPFNHYARDYGQSLTSWWRAGWSAGEDPLYNYVGHPIQGAMTGFIEKQNDPRYENIEFSNTKTYWRSLLQATLWNAVYSTQWSMGPLSEMTVEKYGTKDRPPWNSNGSFPCNTNKCYSGVGKVNLVMTPAGGFGWMLAEDILDKEVAERLEAHTTNQMLIDTVRCALNPIRGGALILHGEHPWYRFRDTQRASSLGDAANEASASGDEAPKSEIANHGNAFFGYTYAAATHCEEMYTGAVIGCDPFSAKTSDLDGWDLSGEKTYLRYFGAVAEFSGQSGGVSQTNSLLGIRGAAWIGSVRPFAQFLIGAVHAHTSGLPSETSFAEDLGLGIDLRLVRRLSWRTETDELKTGSPDFERRNFRLTTGLAVQF
ncbi:MAG TPA: hypothetical protein VEJ67_12230 [Candidatus Cybelea sp.]|nr:hypothetical protein [Candidatus Cybelea sp.]